MLFTESKKSLYIKKKKKLIVLLKSYTLIVHTIIVCFYSMTEGGKELLRPLSFRPFHVYNYLIY